MSEPCLGLTSTDIVLIIGSLSAGVSAILISIRNTIKHSKCLGGEVDFQNSLVETSAIQQIPASPLQLIQASFEWPDPHQTHV